MKLIGKLLVATAAMSLCAPAMAADDPRVTAEVMALARSQWAADIAGQPAARMMETVADDYTEFNGDYPTRIDGKAMALAMANIAPSTKSVYGDMQNAKVQTYGDTAILTYNYAGISRTADGKPNLTAPAPRTASVIRSVMPESTGAPWPGGTG